jgi:pimeloyl-ACP methyl ester carboxylesterase
MTFSMNGRSVDYVEYGAGPCLVFVPGSFSTTAAWRPIIDILKDRYRTVATSLMGCGGTEEMRTADNCTIDQQAEAVEAVVARTGVAVHLIGHSWGGSVALSVALRRIAGLASLVLIEANPCDVLRQSGETEMYDRVRRMCDDYVKAYRAGEQDAARRVIDFWEGAGSFDRMPLRVREYIIQTTPTNILDWSAHWAFRAKLSEYASVLLPALVLHGGQTHPAMRRAAEILAAQMPKARLASVAGARHFLISTHPREVAGAIAEHVSSVEATHAQ